MVSSSEKALVILLRISGIILLTALFAVVMPFSWMEKIHRLLHIGELDADPLTKYFARSLSALYALHGAMVFFVSSDVRRYLPLVKFLSGLTIAFGMIMLAIDLHSGMPGFWIAGEGPFVMALGAILLGLARKTGKAAAPTAPGAR